MRSVHKKHISLKWKERKGGKKGRERRGSERERDEESMRERDRWGSEWLRERGILFKREREKVKESMRRE